MTVIKDYTGRKYGNIELIRYVAPGGKGIGAIWEGVCDCGNRKRFNARNVVAGRVKTCGNCEHHLALLKKRADPGKGLPYRIRRAMSRCISEANARGMTWSITPSEFRRLIGDTCRLCRVELNPSNVSCAPLIPGTQYTPEHIVPVCRGCRRRMNSPTVSEFMEYSIGVLRAVGYSVIVGE